MSKDREQKDRHRHGGDEKHEDEKHREGGKIRLVFVINGEDVPVETSVHAPLLVAVEHALKESDNTGRPATEWEVRDSRGVLLEMSRKVGDFGFKPGDRLFLSLRVGAGGDRTLS